MTEDPSYANVAEWLPTHIRDAIAVTTPCHACPPDHDWWHDRAEIHSAGRLEPVAVIEHWHCTACGVYVQTDPEDYA